MKKKLTLKELEVKSFITALEAAGAIRSGALLPSDVRGGLCAFATHEGDPNCPPSNEIPKPTENCNKPTIQRPVCNLNSGLISCIDGECMI